jgi:hypothetical protein
MKRLILIIAFTIFMGIFFGCTRSSGVLPMGPDTFTITAHSPNQSDSTKKALKEAQDYCRSVGKEIIVTNTSMSGDGLGGYGFNATFRCLSPDDPEYVRPIYKKPADIDIKIEN